MEKIKLFKAFSLSFTFFSMGVCGAILGPTLQTLAYNLQIVVGTISFILPAKSVGYLFGSIASGFMNKKINSHLMIFLSLFVNTVGSLIIPFSQTVTLLAVVNCIIGVASGFLDTSGNVMCLKTWGEKSGPYLQMFHFFFAIGTTVAPLIALPFIMETNGNRYITVSATTKPFFNTTYLITSSEAFHFERFNSVSYAFICCSIICGLVSFCFLYLTCFHKHSVCDQTDTVKEEGSIFRVKMLSLLFAFFLVYVGMEVAFGIYIYMFAIKCENYYSKSEASALNIIFWGSFAVGRCIAIAIAKVCSPFKVMSFDLIGTFVAAIILACFPLYAKSADFVFWIVVGLYGFFMASIFPTGISWAEQYITVTGKAAMVLVVGAATGDMILPFVVGQFIETYPMFLMYFGVVAIFVSTIIFVLLQLLASSKGKRLKTVVNIEGNKMLSIEEIESLALDTDRA